MRSLLIIIFSLLTFDMTYACLSASQNRLFPVGICPEGLVAVETHLQRTEYFDKEKHREKMIPAWRGKAYLKIYNKNHETVYAELINIISLFNQTYYDSLISITFHKGLSKAKDIPGFVSAQPVSISFCDYQQTCSKAALSFDTIRNQIFIKLPGKNRYEVKALTDTTSIASNILNHYLSFDNGDITAETLKNMLYINSVRQFQVADKILTVVHIGCGQTYELAEGGTYPPGNEYKASFDFTDINNSVYTEPVLHHGHGFDFFILE